MELGRIFAEGYYPPLNDKGFSVFAVRHGSSPRYPMSAIVADMRRVVRFIRQHAGEYGVDPNRIGVLGGSAGGQLALLLGTTADSGDPSASDAVLRDSAVDRVESGGDDVDPQHHPRSSSVGIVVDLAGAERCRLAVVQDPELELGS